MRHESLSGRESHELAPEAVQVPEPPSQAAAGGTVKLPGASEADAATASAELARWKRRALRAEGAVYHALWMRPLGPHWAGDGIETAEQMRTRFHQHIERTYPDLIVRDQHQRVQVFNIADTCGCDWEAEDFEELHGEIGEDGEALCSKKFLGYVCDSCKNEDGDGPAWKPYSVAWPCPPIAALDTEAVTARG